MTNMKHLQKRHGTLLSKRKYHGKNCGNRTLLPFQLEKRMIHYLK